MPHRPQTASWHRRSHHPRTARHRRGMEFHFLPFFLLGSGGPPRAPCGGVAGSRSHAASSGLQPSSPSAHAASLTSSVRSSVGRMPAARDPTGTWNDGRPPRGDHESLRETTPVGRSPHPISSRTTSKNLTMSPASTCAASGAAEGDGTRSTQAGGSHLRTLSSGHVTGVPNINLYIGIYAVR